VSLIVCVVVCQVCGAGEVLARFDAGEPEAAQGLQLEGIPSLHRETRAGQTVLRMDPSGRYYEEDVWPFRVSKPGLRRRDKIVLELEFWDEGYGVIAARRLKDPAFNGQYVNAVRSMSYTRLNSKQFRKAAFQFDAGSSDEKNPDKPDFQLTGIQFLRSMRLLDGVYEAYWTALQSAIPHDVQPAVAVPQGKEIVCSAGVEVLGREGMLERSLASLREQAPLAKALGFNGIEAYVRWDLIEPEPGRFDWSFYDAIAAEIQRHGLKMFPLLVVGSAYSLPDWFYRSEENVGFVCLEHGLSNPIQSIWSPYHKKHVIRFLQAFGRHYELMGCLLGVRLGPSGNFGESQYPASGDWGFHGESMHLHIGMWAGDPYALADFQRWLKVKYVDIASLNAAWQSAHREFEEIRMQLPDQCLSKRQRIDLNTWYTDSMSDWCEWWAIEARKAMPNTPIYQSAGGWGAAEIGTDYSAQTKSMLKIKGGIRLTNELDSFHQAYYATRLAATAARNYEVPLGFEPAMGHTARGTAGRLFNCVTNGGAHFFTYGGNIFNYQTSVESWLKHYPLLDLHWKPLVEVALFYPQTMNFLSHDTFRYLNAWGFNPIARSLRDIVEVDYLDDRLILDGFLDRYKALVFVWGNQIERPVLERIDAWLRNGGTVMFPCQLHTRLTTVEGDASCFDRWTRGDIGQGRFCHHIGDDEPPDVYAEFVRAKLLETPTLSHATRIAIEAERPRNVFLSAQADEEFLILNFDDRTATVKHPDLGETTIPPYVIAQVTAHRQR